MVAFNCSCVLLQMGETADATGLIGVESTKTIIDDADETQLLMVTVAEYVPENLVGQLLIKGFCCVEANPTGPVQR